MDNLFSAYEYMLQSCGVWGIALLALLIAVFFIQLWYWTVRYGRIPSYRNAPTGELRPPVSVVVVLHEVDYAFLEETLPVLLSQEYDAMEVVVTDLSGDVEFGEALMLVAEHNPRFSVTRMVRDVRFPISNKMALNVAIKAARYENIIVTTADSRPASAQWAGRMARGFADADVVIGYCGMEQVPGLANRMIRMGRMGRAMRWISAAMRGEPYRGIMQNMGFTKRVYFDNGGFNHLNMNAGEDDLFIQKIVSSARVAVVVSPNSLVRQKAWGGLKWWYTLRKFYSNTFRYYPCRVKRYVGAELWSRFLFFASSATVAVLLPPELAVFAAALFVLREGIVLLEMRRITLRLSEPGLVGISLLYDLVSPFYEAFMAVDRRIRRSPGLWR